MTGAPRENPVCAIDFDGGKPPVMAYFRVN